MNRGIVIASLGLALAGGAVWCPAAEHGTAAEKAESAETKVKLEDCPKAAQETIKTVVGAGQIEDISKESEKGTSVYEVDAKIDGKDYELKVSQDGKLISKKLDDDKEEGEHKGKEDKD